MSKDRKSGLGKFLLGAGIGIGIGMLFTSKNGKENRAALKKKVDELVIKVKSLDSKEIKNNIQEKIDNIMEEISDLEPFEPEKFAQALFDFDV